ncbi:JAB domain-containing protein [uncultured Ezakiella sp.]|uniref:JAB domain-containing protein n=1 Tax=uncultured Ezakiella sp. TaxID=1637529 RepID=UPI0025D81D55|nr:JAB domain-containing protein [uncultured Ezakiella sp.]
MKFYDFSDMLKEDAEDLDIEFFEDDSLLPREKLLENGVQDLRDEELLAILIGTGSHKHSVFDLANMLYEMNGRSLRKVVSMSQRDLAKIRGIGPAKLATLMASFELSKRVYQEEIKVDIERFVTTKRVGSYLVSKLSHYNEEHFFVLLLNNKNEEIDSLIRKDQELFKLSSEEAFGEFFKEQKAYRYVGEDEISKGTVNQTIAMPREVFRKAIDMGASSIILAHNHPSGDVRPSADDINLTRRMVDAGKILGINVLDHFVVGHNSYYSFKENGDI